MVNVEELKIFSGNLRLLCIQNEIRDTHALFNELFERADCFETLHGIIESYKEHKHDLIIVDIDIPTLDVLKKLKKIADTSYIIILSEHASFRKMKEVINLGVNYCVSKPCEEEELFHALLKGTEKAYYHKYLNDIEEDKVIASTHAPLVEEPMVSQVAENVLGDATDHEKTLVLDNETTERIRYSIHDKIDAIDFVEALSPDDLERISDFDEELDSFYSTVDNLAFQNPEIFHTKLSFVGAYFNNFYHIINNMRQFPVMAEAFYAFSEFVYTISLEDAQDVDKNNMFVELMLGLVGDLKSWTDNIFVMQNTNNVNYLDASFANVCIEIEAHFRGQDVVTDGEDDLEFF